MLVQVYEVLFDSSPRLVSVEDGQRSEAIRLDTDDLDTSHFFKVGDKPRKRRLIYESELDRCTIEGLYASINNDGLQIAYLEGGTLALRFGSTEIEINLLSEFANMRRDHKPVTP